MSRWVDNYNEHPFHNVWSNIKERLGDLDKLNDISKENILEIARLKKVIKYIDTLMNNIDPELMPSNFLNNINNHITNARNELNNFIGNKNIGHLQNANNHIDNTLNSFRLSTVFLPNEDIDLSSPIKAYNDEIKHFLEQINKIEKEKEEEKKESIKDIQEWYNKQQESIKEVESNLLTIKQTIEGQTAEFNTQFKSGEESRASKFEKITDNLDNKVDTEFIKTTEKLGSILNVTKDYENQIKRVLNVVVNTAQAGSYNSYANEEKKSANFLRYGALSLMFIGILIILGPEILHIYKLENMSSYHLEIKSIFQRALVSMIIFVPAFYLAKESTKHRMNEVKNRQRELVLSTIDPYLELLHEDKKQELKGEIAKRIFGDIDISIENEDTANILAQLTNFTSQLTKFKK